MSPVCPASHRQSVTAVLPVLSVVALAVQPVHVGPGPALYWPISHAVQLLPGSANPPENPALHWQSDLASLPVPDVSESSGQLVHAAEPRAALYSP